MLTAVESIAASIRSQVRVHDSDVLNYISQLLPPVSAARCRHCTWIYKTI